MTDLTATRDPTPLSPVTSASDTLSSPSSIDFTPIPTPPPQYTPQQTTIIRTPIPPTPLPLFTTLVTDDDMPPIEMFRGSASGKEHAQNWLRKLKANKFTTTTSDADRIFILENHLEVGSRADQWFQAIPIADRVKWTVVEAKFTARWPAAKKPTPTRDELHVRFTNITLGDHDLGKKVGDGEEEDQEWSHIDWAIRVRAAADDIGDPNGNMIPQAKANLPRTIRGLLPAGSDKDWDTFVEAVSLIEISKLLDAVEDRRDIQDIKSIHSAYTSPTPTPTPPTPSTPYRTPYRTAYQRLIPTTPSTPSTPSPIQHTPSAPPPTTPMNRNRALPFASASSSGSTLVHTQAPATPLSRSSSNETTFHKWATIAMANNQPFANTQEGHAAYNKALSDWNAKYGIDAKADWHTWPVPLKPGTSPLGSSECYNCGIAGHGRATCPNPLNSIPKREADWRARINGIVHPKRARFNQPESPGTLPIFLIDGVETMVDPDVYPTDGLEFYESDQGNE